jgi:hypothetical protein
MIAPNSLGLTPSCLRIGIDVIASNQLDLKPSSLRTGIGGMVPGGTCFIGPDTLVFEDKITSSYKSDVVLFEYMVMNKPHVIVSVICHYHTYL